MRFVFRAALLSASMLSPMAALAQTTPATPQDAAAAGDAVSDQDIVITARKFDEKLQNAPTTVAVATSQTIDKLGLTSVADISKITPGLVLDNSFGRSGGDRPVIRGQANINGFSGVAYFIDGIYYSGSLADFDPYNIARMEVIKGPQSALYGRNTYSGAINIITKSPGDTFSARARADVSEHGRYDFSAGISGPLTKGLGFILNGRYLDDKGEFRNAFNGGRLGAQRTASISGMLKYDDGGPLRVSLRANYNDSKDGQPAIFATTTYENNCFRDNGSIYKGAGRYFCGVLQPRQATSDYTRRFTSPDVDGTRTKTLNTALRIDYDLSDSFTLTSLTGYNHRIYDVKLDGDYNGLGFQQGIFGSFAASFPNACGAGVPFGAGIYCIVNAGAATDFTNSTNEKLRDFSQEVRLQYQSDKLKVLLGGYYFRQKVDNFDDRVLPADALAQAQAASVIQYAQFCAFIPGCTRAYGTTAVSIATPDRNTSYLTTRNVAVFGSIDYKFTDTLSISAEGRYAEERVRQELVNYILGATPPPAIVNTSTFRRFTPRVTLSWQAAPNNLLYAIYAEGAKPGGFNGGLALTAGVPTYDAETSRTYEVGSKNTFLGGALTANVALFRTDIKGYQLSQAILVTNPATGGLNQVSVIRNAGDARIQGGELSLIIRPDRSLTVTANYAYATSKFTSGTDQNYGVLLDAADDGLVNCSTGRQFATGSCVSVYGSIVGKQIPRAPKNTIFVDVDWRHSVGGDLTFFAGANVNVLSNSYEQVVNFVKTGGSAVVDARIGIEGAHFKLQGYVRNLFNEDSVLQIIRYAGDDLRRNFIAGLRPARRIGVIAEVKF